MASAVEEKVVTTVAIIGAGAAGLYAARELRRAGCADVVILEASEHVGGRIRSQPLEQGMAPVDLGPQFIHGGSHNVLVDVVKEMGRSMRELEWPNYVYLAREGRLLSQADAEADEDIQSMHDAFASLGESDGDVSLLLALAGKQVPLRVMGLADAIYANDYGAALSDVGVREVVVEQEAWNHGEEYLVLEEGTLHDVALHLAEDAKIVHGFDACRVEVDTSGAEPITILSSAGRRVACRVALVTVPLPVLQQGALVFSPPLPEDKVQSVQAIRMGNAIKIVLQFSHRFWPEDFWDAVCSDAMVPEWWVVDALVAVGFIAGRHADALGRLPKAELARRALRQLDDMFGTADDPSPATSACTARLVFNWGEVPFIGAAYSHPSRGAGRAREVLSRPEFEGRVHFAGEATNVSVNPCVNGAMETGRRAAADILAELERRARAE